MTVPKRHIGPVFLVCLAFSFLLLHAGRTPAHPAKPSISTAHRHLSHIPPAVPLLLPARSQRTLYDRFACRLACEQIGFWEMEQELTYRLVNACKIGCSLGQDHCL
jgi:hypothetical protein